MKIYFIFTHLAKTKHDLCPDLNQILGDIGFPYINSSALPKFYLFLYCLFFSVKVILNAIWKRLSADKDYFLLKYPRYLISQKPNFFSIQNFIAFFKGLNISLWSRNRTFHLQWNSLWNTMRQQTSKTGNCVNYQCLPSCLSSEISNQ